MEIRPNRTVSFSLMNLACLFIYTWKKTSFFFSFILFDPCLFLCNLFNISILLSLYIYSNCIKDIFPSAEWSQAKKTGNEQQLQGIIQRPRNIERTLSLYLYYGISHIIVTCYWVHNIWTDITQTPEFTCRWSVICFFFFVKRGLPNSGPKNVEFHPDG